jgi:site-specific recombinase XerD
VVTIRLKYLVSDVDRYGRRRYYVRIKGKKKVRINAEPGTEEFSFQYHQAVKGALPVQVQRVKPQSLAWLITHYFASADFQSGAKATQTQRRSILGRIAKSENADKDCRTLTQAAVMAGRDARRKTPGAANNYLKAVKALYVWGMEMGHVSHNPAVGVKRLKTGESSWRPWTAEECAQFEKTHPVGTIARAVYALGRYGGLRRADIAKAGRQHRKNGFFSLQQTKTGQWVEFIEPPQLTEALDAAPITGMHYAQTEYGKPFTDKGLGARFKKWTLEAGLPKDLSLHGLRKALGVSFAEGGATQEEIAAALGHSGTKTAEIYTKGAEKRRMASAAHAKIHRTNGKEKVPLETAKVSHSDKKL